MTDEVMCSHYLGENFTNNEAEYHGLLLGLEAAVNKGIPGVIVHGDSKLVIEQVGGNYSVNAKNLRKLHRKAVKLTREFPAGVSLVHIDRDKNRRTDQLANKAMDHTSSKVYTTQNWESAEFLSPILYSTLDKPTLRKLCAEYGMKIKGNRPTLIERLIMHRRIPCDEDFYKFVEKRGWSAAELKLQGADIEKRLMAHKWLEAGDLTIPEIFSLKNMAELRKETKESGLRWRDGTRHDLYRRLATHQSI